MAKNEDRRSIRCSFCGKPQSLRSTGLIAGNGSYICDECVRMCMQIVDDDPMTDTPGGGALTASRSMFERRCPSPCEIKAGLDEYVIGQEPREKGPLSVAVYNHYKRILHWLAEDRCGASEEQYPAASAPPAVGKTLLAQTLGQDAERAVCHRRRDHADRGRLCRRGR